MINAGNLDDYFHRLRQGERTVLAQAMTLVESQLPRHQELSARLIDSIMPYTGQAKRLGITGTPGAGKSTFLEALGEELLAQGHRVAVIAIDPSSPISGGSILGDKTRMLNLSRAEQAFIRPVPSGGYLGGISQCTRELILLCEAAGYDVVIVETVGVGQSETEVAQMVDCFLSLQIAGAGDDLQGIKKGIMEMADLIVINKDDGDNHANVDIARHMYHSALHIIRRKYPDWQPCVLSCSALEKRGIGEVWQTLLRFWSVMSHSGQLARLRQQQNIDWVHHQIESNALKLMLSNQDLCQYYQHIEQLLRQNQLSPRAAVNSVTEFMTQKILN
ncbi:TPA: methylmalonyl Co-A mutase-associated GTPase MeaB [Yersinia enterocolitica]|nr:methylmalonyl Co-A mutase-associated GTPase MeaB [Yersinia enterocolitica]